FQKGDRARANATWKRIVANGKAASHAKLGEVMAEHNFTTDALREYGEAIRIDPKNPDFYKGRAAVYEASRNWDLASRDWEMVLGLIGGKPSDRLARREARKHYVQLIVRWGQKETERRNDWQTRFRA